MRICVLTSSYAGSRSAFAGHDPPASPSPYAPQHTWRHEAIDKARAAAQIRDLAREGFDVFVNLCDGAWDEDRAGIEVIDALQRLGQAWTGAEAAGYEPSRETMKQVCWYAGVAVPPWRVARDEAGLREAARAVGLPAIVKHPSSYGSIGMGRDARCESETALVQVGLRMIARFGAALVERFVEGREFTVLVAEPGEGERAPRTWPPIEFCFPPGETFKHFDLKWIDWAGMETRSVEDDDLARRLRDASAALFAGLRCAGYARCDLRVDAAGRVFMLEINPNCGIFYPPDAFGSADFILAASPGGHAAFLDHILACALRHQRSRQPAVAVAFEPGKGYHAVAARDLVAGEVVLPGEERPAVLVSRSHVEATWSAEQRGWFGPYTWPLSNGVHAMWAERPEEWRPINHSCAPNAWLCGLDVVARDAIAGGVEITLDYATFCGPDLQSFACRCGAPLCRGVIRPTDHLLHAVACAYGEHRSDYVKAACAALPRPDLRVEQSDGERRTVATRAFAAGETVARFRIARTVEAPQRHTVQVGVGVHAEVEPAEVECLGHSCQPNARFDPGAGTVVAVRPMGAGEAVTVACPDTDAAIAAPLCCRCGAQGCVGAVGAEPS